MHPFLWCFCYSLYVWQYEVTISYTFVFINWTDVYWCVSESKRVNSAIMVWEVILIMVWNISISDVICGIRIIELILLSWWVKKDLLEILKSNWKWFKGIITRENRCWTFKKSRRRNCTLKSQKSLFVILTISHN